MRQVLSQFVSDDRGQDLIEYAMLVLFLACAVLIGIQAIPGSLNEGYSNIGTQVSAGS
jgi:Flp pilus assembly pilin Flp